jgi:hypothetical protein
MSIGASIRVERPNLPPLIFLLSFDKFESLRTCDLKWRNGDFVGLAWETKRMSRAPSTSAPIPQYICNPD